MVVWLGASILAGCGGSSDNSAVANLPPTVVLAAPSAGTPGSAITLTATASDSDDGVANSEERSGRSSRTVWTLFGWGGDGGKRVRMLWYIR